MKGAFEPSWTAFIVLTTVDQMVCILTLTTSGRAKIANFGVGENDHARVG